VRPEMEAWLDRWCEDHGISRSPSVEAPSEGDKSVVRLKPGEVVVRLKPDELLALSGLLESVEQGLTPDPALGGQLRALLEEQLADSDDGTPGGGRFPRRRRGTPPAEPKPKRKSAVAGKRSKATSRSKSPRATPAARPVQILL
jgi:hypothetical protein